MTFPLTYLGDGKFECSGYHARRLPYGQGEIITVEEVQERSLKSHAHYFATITEAWRNLPENLVDDFPNSETLRKHALIKTGFCSMSRVVCGSNPDAIAMAAIIGTMDRYCICEVAGRVLTIWRADSQSKKAMGAKKFQESKERTLDWIGTLIGADLSTVSEAA